LMFRPIGLSSAPPQPSLRAGIPALLSTDVRNYGDA
jgi:hypothetical protein